MERSINDFVVLEILGGGSFGTVHKAVEKSTGISYALKKLTMPSNTIPLCVYREIQALRSLSDLQEHIISYEGCFAWGSSLCIILELADTNLKSLLEERVSLSEPMAKYVMFNLIRGLHYCHSEGIIHRDLKPSNILLCGGKQIVKIADFGQARTNWRSASSQGKLSHQVSTRWYRAPELLYGSQTYSETVDLWSVGVIFAEILQGYTPFPGENDIDQIVKIIRKLGSPPSSFYNNLPDSGKIEFPEIPSSIFSIDGVSVPTNRLIQNLLQYEPEFRPSTEKMLLDDCFIATPSPLCI